MEVLLDCISSACLSLFVESHNSSKNLPKDVEKQDEFIKGPEWLVEPDRIANSPDHSSPTFLNVFIKFKNPICSS